jgi:tetratricopeptide (TPR) repeat protein
MTTSVRKGVAAIAGRRIDAPGADPSRFPPSAAAVVKAGVARLLKKHEVGTLVASAACGADILALEAAEENGARTRIILPFAADRFRQTSVVDRGGDWGERFDALMKRAGARGDVVVLAPEADGDEAAYGRATARIVAEAAELAARAGVKPIAIPICDAAPKARADATKDFADRAEAAGMTVFTISSTPLEVARSFLESGGGWDAEPVLDLQSDLSVAEPAVAAQLARELASRFLKRQKPLTTEVVDRIWKACKQVEAFGFARRVLGRRVERWEQIIVKPYPDEPSDLTLRQQRALCTSKDPDLSAAMRHDWALEILRPEQEPNDAETQGIAGGIWKRRWEWDGERTSLERALEHYRAGGGKENLLKDDGYLAINCAFVLDLLANLMRDAAAAARYVAEADEIRRTLVGRVPGDNKWRNASLAEAYFGLGEIDQAVLAIDRYARASPESWEIETTLRQIVRLGHLRKIPEAEIARVLAVPLFKQGSPGADPRLASLLTGRVGLALSGGGFRASLYHLGVLARLAESDILRHIEVLSCVSGGSIVGAHYYLALREALSTKGEALKRDDYVAVVEQVIRDFCEGVAENVRTRVLANLADSHAVVSGDDARYAERVSSILHECFYAKHVPEKTGLHELLIQPADAPPNFHPGRHNWTRRNKVPALIINAATLNTGHNWQFTARSMGESPFSIQSTVDSNPRLRRANYLDGAPDRTVLLRNAVAASACVPGLFAPMRLDALYPEYRVKLVDGGVFENQGIAGLIEQDCQVLFVSDASGQLGAERSAEGGHVAPLLRSVGIFQERMRQAGYDGLRKRQEAGQVRGLAYVHLTQGLRSPPTDWTGCEDPHEPNDQLPKDALAGVKTPYGVNKEIQRYLANMRTDLDVFSEIECAALMVSGYKAMDWQLDELLTRVPSLAAQRQPREWVFSPLMALVNGPEAHAGAYDALKKHLAVSDSAIGRTSKLDTVVRWVVLSAALVLFVVIVGAAWALSDKPVFTVGTLAILCAGMAARFLWGNWAALIVDPRRALRVPLYHWLGAVALWAFANVVLKWIDPRYRDRGRLTTLALAIAASAPARAQSAVTQVV